ncbi:hypothetical protein KKB99_08220 [bacterium]|nr:hypothetical protein [bacterium]MBU1025976.1 hypothetical protein [bacterium]
MTKYIVTDDRRVRLHYDPVGGVFRKEIYSWVAEDWNLTKNNIITLRGRFNAGVLLMGKHDW